MSRISAENSNLSLPSLLSGMLRSTGIYCFRYHSYICWYQKNKFECFQWWHGQNFLQPPLLTKDEAVRFSKILCFCMGEQFRMKRKAGVWKRISWGIREYSASPACLDLPDHKLVMSIWTGSHCGTSCPASCLGQQLITRCQKTEQR